MVGKGRRVFKPLKIFRCGAAMVLNKSTSCLLITFIHRRPSMAEQRRTDISPLDIPPDSPTDRIPYRFFIGRTKAPDADRNVWIVNYTVIWTRRQLRT